MTDRINALTVTLTDNMRDDDCAGLIQAIQRLRGVEDVQPHVTHPLDEHVAKVRIKGEISAALREVLS